MKTEESNSPDYSHWAKKFDKVKHIYSSEKTPGVNGPYGTLCGSVAHCLGNNYATHGMSVCEECLKIQGNG